MNAAEYAAKRAISLDRFVLYVDDAGMVNGGFSLSDNGWFHNVQTSGSWDREIFRPSSVGSFGMVKPAQLDSP